MPTYTATTLVPPEVEAKDPDAEIDYGVDWRDWLEDAETITAVTWTVPAGLVEERASESGGVARVWLSGGNPGSTYLVSCKITTTMNRTDERSFRLPCRQR